MCFMSVEKRNFHLPEETGVPTKLIHLVSEEYTWQCMQRVIFFFKTGKFLLNCYKFVDYYSF